MLQAATQLPSNASRLLVAVRFEESDLVRIHGDDYRARAPMIFPRPGYRYS